MFRNLLGKILGDPNAKEIALLQPLVQAINAREPTYVWMTNAELQAQASQLRQRVQHGEGLDDILPDAFALVREAAKRTVGMRHFDVQLIGGIVLHQGKVAEMKTGEGKTLVATLPISLNALTGKGVHLVTVNDYLARRDAVWNGPVYDMMGLSVGLLQQSNKSFVYEHGFSKSEYPHLRPVPRGEAYAADITYGTNHEFGFDYLRDNLAYVTAEQVQRPLYYGIVDEVDNVFIDEARTPLIISGATEEDDEEYRRFARIAPHLEGSVDYELDEKNRTVFLTEAGLAKVEELGSIDNIYDPVNQRYVHYMEQAVKAQVLFHEGRDYIRQRDRIVLVDEFTGRLMPDRRLSDGLHQAIEAKHGLKVRARMVTQATITIQNYFRMYPKLAGMTGTALSEAEEFHKIYNLDVMTIPTNKPMIRQDAADAVYRTTAAKIDAIVGEIEDAHQRGQPMLVGTTSVEKSEELSRRLQAHHIEHFVLNAKEHTSEARIVARAGEPGRVTVATNMAGRGVDIKLGGDLSDETMEQAQRVLRQRGIDPFQAEPDQLYSAVAEVDPDYALRREQVLAAGGLYVLGTERHEARRIDNQLRGRSGRQGEPGLSRFFLALDDDLMRRFGGENVSRLMGRLGVEDDMPIEHGLVSRSIESAQTRVEGYNFDIRKHLLEYDDVLNKQREMIYRQRQRILTKDDLWPDLWDMIRAEIEERAGELENQPEKSWELINLLDLLMPVSYAPVAVQKGSKGRHGKTPGAVLAYESMRYPYALSAVRSIFLPFTISFLAHDMAEREADERREALLALSERAIQMYRRYLVEDAIGETFRKTLEKYEEGWQQQKEILEQRIMTYQDMLEERGRPFNPREMLDQVQKGLPLNVVVSGRDINSMEADDVRAMLEGALEQAYHIATSNQLVKRVESQVPENLGLGSASIDIVDADEQRRLLGRAELSAYSDEGRRRIQQLSEDDSGRKAKGDRSLAGWLSRLLGWTRLDLSDLERVLGAVIAHLYDSWAERALRDVGERAGEKIAASDQTAVGQWVLNAFAVVDPQTFRIAWRIPPAFLVAALTDGIPLQERITTFEAHLKGDVMGRQETWGEAELARYGQLRLAELGEELLESTARYWGGQQIGDLGLTVAELPAEYLETLQRVVTVTDWRDLQIGAWPPFEAVAQRVSATIGERLSSDPYLMGRAEEALILGGWFDNSEAEGQFLAQRVADLARADREEIAAYLGEQLLAPLRSEKIAALESGLRQRVLTLLTARGRFTDEERVQDLLIRRRLNDLGDELADNACRQLVVGQLELERTRSIEELDPTLRDRVVESLRAAGLIWDETSRQKTLQQPLVQLSPDVQRSLLATLAAAQWPDGLPAGQLTGQTRTVVRQVLDEAGLFLLRQRYDAFGLTDISRLPADEKEALRSYLGSRLKALLEAKKGRELSRTLYVRVRRYLGEAGYFLDAAKSSRLGGRSIASLDGKVITAIERSLGRDLLSEVDKRQFLNLDRELREAILGYLDKENIYRKSAKRRAFMQRPLAELDPAIYDGVAQYLGRRALAPVRAQPIQQAPEKVQAVVRQEALAAGDLLDETRVQAFENATFADLPADVRLRVENRLLRDLDALIAGERVEELYDGILLDSREFLARRGTFTRPDADQEFERLAPEILESGLRERVYATLGQPWLELMAQQAVVALPAHQREPLIAALEKTSAFVDPAKEQRFLKTRLVDLAPKDRDAIIAVWAGRLRREIGDQRVATLPEETRQGLRTYLDKTGYFIDGTRTVQAQEQPLAALRREDWQALTLEIGAEQLHAYSGSTIADLPADLKGRVLDFVRAKRGFLDEARLAAFRAGGLPAVPTAGHAAALSQAAEAERGRLRTATVSHLPPALRWAVLQAAIDSAPAAEYRRMRELEKTAVGDLDSNLYATFLCYLGYPQTTALAASRLADLQGEEREVMRGFLGHRVALEIQKRVMLSYVSRLWIDYLTDIEDLRQGIGLEAFGQRDPLVEYKRRAYQMFQELTQEIRRGIVSRVFALEPFELTIGKDA